MGQKLIIAAGIVLITGMLVTASFSLGIYVGKYGWTKDELVPQEHMDNLPLHHNGHPPDVVGIIQDIYSDMMMLTTTEGIRMVELHDEVRIETDEGDECLLNEVMYGIKGEYAAIFGHFGESGRVLIADLIVLLPSLYYPQD
jgi:hypothetical protein